MYYAITICIFMGYLNMDTTLALQGQGSCSVCGKINEPLDFHWMIKGNVVEPYNKYPWVVSLKLPGNSKRICAGAIISENFILTAAHCVTNPSEDASTISYMKSAELEIVFLDNMVAKIALIIPHPKFGSSELFKNDIALLKLQNTIQCGPSKNPICLPASNAVRPITGSKMSVNGWGQTEGYHTGDDSDVLREAEMRFVNPRECSAHINFNQESMYCLSRLGVQSPCFGDYGGIGYTKIRKSYFAIGVTSTHISRNCRLKAPSVFTAVSVYMKWILQVLDSHHVRKGP